MARPQLDAKVMAMVPKPLTLNQASMGFKNQGQFLAALIAAKRLGCNCFARIQTDMTKKGLSLGQAIQDVKSSANATLVARKAATEAEDDIKGTTTTTTSTSATTSKPTNTSTSTSTSPTRTKKPAQGDR